MGAELFEVGGFSIVQLAAVPDAGEGTSRMSPRAIVPLPHCGMPGLVESVGESVGVIAPGCAQHDQTRSRSRMTGHKLPSHYLSCGTRPVGTAVGSAQLQLPAPPCGEFIPIQTLNSRQRPARTRFAFAPAAKKRCNSGKWRSALQEYDLVAADYIGTALRDNNELWRFLRFRDSGVAPQQLDRIAEVGMIDLANELYGWNIAGNSHIDCLCVADRRFPFLDEFVQRNGIVRGSHLGKEILVVDHTAEPRQDSQVLVVAH